jgi:branched-subunit amino acid transport protein
MIIALAASAYLLKMFGLVVLGSRQLPKVFDRCLGLIPAALLSALVLKDTFSLGQSLVVDARVAGFAVAVVAVDRGCCFGGDSNGAGSRYLKLCNLTFSSSAT